MLQECLDYKLHRSRGDIAAIKKDAKNKDMPTVCEVQGALDMLRTDDTPELRLRIRQRLLALIERIEVTVEGETAFCTVVFQDGHNKGVFFDKDRIGLWAAGSVPGRRYTSPHDGE